MEKAFTIIELLIVIAIILIIAGFMAVFAKPVANRAKIDRTKAIIMRMETAISQYMDDFKAYPPGSSNANLTKLLSDLSTYNTNPNWHGPYYEADETVQGGQIVDAWGNPLRYNRPGFIKNRPEFVDIYSIGPNGIDENGGGDDITN